MTKFWLMVCALKPWSTTSVAGFDNYAEYLDLYGCDRIIPEMKRLRIASRRQLPSALRDQLGIAAFSDGVEAQIEAFGKAA
ncbi:hypothetical protein QWZ10_25100 [Paracoccus cavernae]|uniref:Uncharacterized protein n=1 Tax=Paracoccus cavernae TaxID=1571207 RepID=A0ABT8DCS3_9RHOB|nr:hypothetical protein [Paracoccus cavernae]